MTATTTIATTTEIAMQAKATTAIKMLAMAAMLVSSAYYDLTFNAARMSRELAWQPTSSRETIVCPPEPQLNRFRLTARISNDWPRHRPCCVALHCFEANLSKLTPHDSHPLERLISQHLHRHTHSHAACLTAARILHLCRDMRCLRADKASRKRLATCINTSANVTWPTDRQPMKTTAKLYGPLPFRTRNEVVSNDRSRRHVAICTQLLRITRREMMSGCLLSVCADPRHSPRENKRRAARLPGARGSPKDIHGCLLRAREYL